MEQNLTPVITPSALIVLTQTTPFILIDARAGTTSEVQYEATHLKGALYVDLETQLSNKKLDAAEGGRHPLPDPVKFSRVLSELGITQGSHVIVYDDKNASNAAARFWWMLRAAGHEKVQVVDGGLSASILAGFPTATGKEKPRVVTSYKIDKWQLPLVGINEVTTAVQSEEYLVIDVRDAVRFRGEKEPIDLIAGHIPGAVNIPFTSNLDQEGFFLSPSELKENYTRALDNRQSGKVIVHCGSGVTACHTLLAMAQAGMEIPALYIGSWSEWSRNDKPIGTGSGF
ncbi:MAG: sulfurtransferase [Ferruginibacter sp.]